MLMNGEMPWTRIVIWSLMALYFGRGIYINFKNKEWGYFLGSIWICCFGIYAVLMEFGLVPSFWD